MNTANIFPATTTILFLVTVVFQKNTLVSFILYLTLISYFYAGKSKKTNVMLKINRGRNWIFFKKASNNLTTLIFLISIQLFIGNNRLFAQVVKSDTTTLSSSRELVHAPYVYIDCRYCDYDFIRTELTFVNYVRDPEMADIHVFVTDERTAGGGREYQFSFIGRRTFAGTEYTLKHHIDHNATSEEVRKALTGFLKMGFASYMLQTPLGTRFSIEYEDNGEDETLQVVQDPWDYWVFQTYVGRVQLDMESNQNEFNSRWGFYADRVTEEWKIRIRPYFNYRRVKIQTSQLEAPVISSQHRHGLESYAIKSLSNHWSAGLFVTYLTNNERNTRHEIIASPGIEYSLFPYEMATRKSITFTYQMGYGYYNYYDETIFNKTEETLLNHQLKGVVNIQQPWGSIETGLVGSHYLHYFNRRRITFYGRTSVRLFKGFSLSFQADYNVISDQLSLPKGDASLEEVLLRQRELATNYSFSSSIAITYTFGSKFTNIVNTRF